MTLDLDPAIEQRLQRQLESGAYSGPDDFFAHALDLVEAQHVMDDWLVRNKEAINRDLDESFAAESRGESYSPEESKAILAARRAARANPPA